MSGTVCASTITTRAICLGAIKGLTVSVVFVPFTALIVVDTVAARLTRVSGPHGDNPDFVLAMGY